MIGDENYIQMTKGRETPQMEVSKFSNNESCDFVNP
jgi:hypothetical protein